MFLVQRTVAQETASFFVHSKKDVLYLGVEFFDLLLVSLSSPYKFPHFNFGVHVLRKSA